MVQAAGIKVISQSSDVSLYAFCSVLFLDVGLGLD